VQCVLSSAFLWYNILTIQPGILRLTSSVTYGTTQYGIIPHEQWYQPDWIDEERATKAREKLTQNRVLYGGIILYTQVPYHFHLYVSIGSVTLVYCAAYVSNSLKGSQISQHVSIQRGCMWLIDVSNSNFLHAFSSSSIMNYWKISTITGESSQCNFFFFVFVLVNAFKGLAFTFIAILIMIPLSSCKTTIKFTVRALCPSFYSISHIC
jgi:hypothetical protein